MYPHGIVDDADLKIDLWRSSGTEKSGDWAMRITHIPSGVEAIANGEFAAGDDPEAEIKAARARLVEEIATKIKDA